ncbi:MAG: MATE family efflux transporter, partial [Bacteroidota bacterium]
MKNQVSTFRLNKKDLSDTLELSYPIIVGQLGLVAMGLTDNLMVGGLGASALAAAGIANAIFFLIAVVGIGILSMISPITATARSRGDLQKCSQILSSGYQLAWKVGVISALVTFLIGFRFDLFHQKPGVESLAVSYLSIIGLSSIPMFIFLAVKNFTDGLSFTKVAMIVTFVCFLLNIGLNWVFIYGKLGMPSFGLDGAGLATLVSRILMALGMTWYVFQSPRILHYLPNFKYWTFYPAISRKILKLGLPAGLQYVFEVGAFAGASVIIGWLGTHQLAAHQIGISLASITYMVAGGFAAAASIRVGDALGEQNREKILQRGSSAIFLTGIFMILSCLVFIFFNELLVSFYIDDPEVTQIAASLLIIAGFFQLSDGIQCVALGALRGIEDVNIPTFITLF